MVILKKTIMKTLKIPLLLLVLLLLSNTKLDAQEIENDFQYRSSFQLSLKPAKKLKLSFTPELRFNDEFSLSSYLIESELTYKPLKYLYLGGNYRFTINPRDSKETEYNHRFGLSATVKKKFDRFTPALRVFYTNYADDDSEDNSDNNFMRYKLSLNYNIKKCKLTPTIGAELIQQLENNEIYKMRYSANLNYKLFKNNYLSLNYKLDYYIKEYRNKHIISLSYKLKL